jgi:hypothetical protein
MSVERANLGLDPGLAEGGNILSGVPVQQQLIVDQLVGGRWIGLVFGQFVLGQGMRKTPGAKYFVITVGDNFFFA